jgi:hypothetical protein
MPAYLPVTQPVQRFRLQVLTVNKNFGEVESQPLQNGKAKKIKKGMKNEKSKTIWRNRRRLQHPCFKRARDKGIGRNTIFGYVLVLDTGCI